MNLADMEELGLSEGDQVRVRSTEGEVVATVSPADMPSGMVFMPMGETANRLVGVHTSGTGMPPFKSMQVEVSAL